MLIKKLIIIILAAAPWIGLAQTNINAVEYFFDSDPGVGNATAVTSFSASGNIDVSFPVASSGLSSGIHILGVRVKDDTDTWSIPFFTAVYVFLNDPLATETIIAAEYFFDTDPGFGNATPLTGISAGTVVDVSALANTASLNVGMHVLGIRVMNNLGLWSQPSYSSFYIDINREINKLEYFFDNDPGIGNGTLITFTAATDIDTDVVLPTSALPAGSHTVGVRVGREDDNWSETVESPFMICSYATPSFSADTVCVGTATSFTNNSTETLPGDEYNWDFDNDGTIDDTTVGSVSFTYPATGTYTASLEIDRSGCTNVYTATVVVQAGLTAATASFTTDPVCAGTETSFIDNSTGTLPGDAYSWDFDNDGTIDDTTVGPVTFTYAGAGTYTASLEIDRSGCTNVFTTSVVVEATPTADAGADQNLCGDNTSLNANQVNAGETGLWTILTGTAAITDTNAPTTSVTGITSLSTVLEWTVTNDLVGCSASDQLTIISNQPIQAEQLIATASLGQTTNTNVTDAVTVNPGDVLTTAIIGLPEKGTATVLSDGTIDYTPSPGTVGRDTVLFEVCNQCSRCSSNNLVIDIANNAPTVTVPPVTTAGGQTVSLDLSGMIADPNNNLDPASFRITQQPISGATATIIPPFSIRIDYTGIAFSGTDQLTIEVCDLSSACSASVIAIEVEVEPTPSDPPIIVYNAVSPNGDGKHDFLEIENITAYSGNIVYITNRWGNRVYEAKDYDNSRVRFTGEGNTGGAADLPGGTYYYSIDTGKGQSLITGFLVLKK